MSISQVFISYRNHDASRLTAIPLEEKLRTVGYNVFLDVKSLVASDNWQEEIYENVRASDVLILLLEQESDSAWVQREVAMARGANVTIIPVQVVRDLKLPEILKPFALENQQALLYQGLAHEWEALTKAIQKAIAKTHTAQNRWINERQVRLNPVQAPSLNKFDQGAQAYKTYRLRDGKSSTQVILATGDMMEKVGIDVFVNTENDFLQMARFFESATISALLRRQGALFNKAGQLTEDTVQDELVDQLRAWEEVRPVGIGTVFVTHAGHPNSLLRKKNKARYIFHTVSVRTNYDDVHKTTRPVPGNLHRATCNTLEKVLEVNTNCGVVSPENGTLWQQEIATADNYQPINSIIFPIFGTGHSGESPEVALPQMIAAFADFLQDHPDNPLQEIYLCAYFQEHARLAEQLLDQRFKVLR